MLKIDSYRWMARYTDVADYETFQWKAFSSVPYHVTRNERNGRILFTPQAITDHRTFAVYTFDTLGDVLASARTVVWDNLTQSGNYKSVTTGYVARCGPPCLSVFYRLPLFDLPGG